MLYSIILPILVVLSLVGLILFLMKKAAQVARLQENDAVDEGEAYFNSNGDRVVANAKVAKLKVAEGWLLAGLEKVFHLFHAIFVRMGVVLTAGRAQIRNRRKNNGATIERIVDMSAKTEEGDIMKKLQNYAPVTKRAQEIAEIQQTPVAAQITKLDRVASVGRKHFGVAQKRAKEMVTEAYPAREKIVRPIVSEKMVRPRMKAEMKDRLEELLIERIAINPKDVEAYERLGEYYMEIENYQFAKECFKQVVKLDPSNKNVKNKMRRLEYLLGR